MRVNGSTLTAFVSLHYRHAFLRVDAVARKGNKSIGTTRDTLWMRHDATAIFMALRNLVKSDDLG